MEKSQIVKLFLEKGYFLEPQALNYLSKNPEKLSLVLGKIEKLEGKTISLENLNLILKKPRVEILKQHTRRKKYQVSIQDFHKFCVEKYNSIKKILENKTELVNLISINKITKKLKEFSIIATLIEKNEEDGYVVVEDLTGSTNVYLNSSEDIEKINLNEIVGIKCRIEDGKIFGDDFLQPDVPLRRDITKTKENIHCLFISDLHMDSKDFSRKSYENFLKWIEKQNYENLFVFILGNVSSKKQDILDFFSIFPENSFKIFVKGERDCNIDVGDLTINSPCILKLEGVTILTASGLPDQQKLNPTEILLTTLKKRYIELGAMDYFLIDVVPDIFVSGGLRYASEFNYKTITLLSTGNFIFQPMFWMINLASRKTIRIDFS